MILPELIGPIIYRREITELSGEYLAQYEAKRIYIDLTPEETEHYHRTRGIYREFIERLGIVGNWQRFIFESTRSPDGQAAMRAYREQKLVERTASGKFKALEEIMRRHAKERMIIFTADNSTVYRIAREYLVPAITHQTKAKERKQILERFHSGEYTILVTSQVLNEGVDVPAAGVGVVLSGTGTIKENVQRLGRILRKYKDKQAVLYEVVARGTAGVHQRASAATPRLPTDGIGLLCLRNWENGRKRISIDMEAYSWNDPVDDEMPLLFPPPPEDDVVPEETNIRKRLHWKSELTLALLPTLTVLLVLWFIEVYGHERLLFASLASSAFLIYVDPQLKMNRIRT